MIVAQTLLITPIVVSLTRQVVEDLWGEYEEQLRSLGSSRLRAVPTLLWDGRFSLITAMLAGFGRASAEVGAILIVGGNIAGYTRTMTTAIALETSRGDLALALGPRHHPARDHPVPQRRRLLTGPSRPEGGGVNAMHGGFQHPAALASRRLPTPCAGERSWTASRSRSSAAGARSSWARTAPARA